MTRSAIVAGAGMGGLAAALRLARAGFEVRLLEARDQAGGLASGLVADGQEHDGGPYVLLDRPGLGWAFSELGLDLETEVALRRLADVYQVDADEALPVRVASSLDETAEGFERRSSGSGARYRAFVGRCERSRSRLEPLLRKSAPGPLDLVGSPAWRDAPFLLRPSRASSPAAACRTRCSARSRSGRTSRARTRRARPRPWRSCRR